MRRAAILAVVTGVFIAIVPAAGARVLRVGTYKGIHGQFKSIQAAVNAAKSGDWILVGPGDYKTKSIRAPKGAPDTPAAVLITTANLKLRGMNRNKVVIDGTKPGSGRCSTKQAAQSFGPTGKGGALGLNGIVVWKANSVWVQNLTACNFLGGTGGDGQTGNGIWWNGGAGSAKIGGWGFQGSYLTATSTFFKDESTAAQYGIFSSDWNGGTWDQTYASNFNDSGLYIGACQQQCNQTVDHTWSEYNALGYSGSNSGGRLVIENSQFDNNEDGFDTNSQNGDNPPPQDGACPSNGISKITHTHSCWVFMHNYVHDNNNPNVPSAGAAAAGPVGTGMSVTRRPERHDHGQPVREQQRVGGDPRTVPRQRPAVHRRHAELTAARPGELPLRRVGRRAPAQHVQPQRWIRESDERRLRSAELRVASERLLPWEHQHRGQPHARGGEAGAGQPHVHNELGCPELQSAVPQRGPVRLRDPPPAVRVPIRRSVSAPD